MTVLALACWALRSALAAAPGLQWWYVPASEKVFPDSRPPAQRELGHLYCARGEYEAVQLALRSERQDCTLAVRCVPSSPAAAAAPSFDPAWVELFEVRYVPTPADATHPRCPDPLVPLSKGDRLGHLTLRAGETKAIWVRVRVPEQAAAGCYAGHLWVGHVQAGRRPQSLTAPSAQTLLEAPLKLTVWPFRLPRRSHLRTAFGIDGACIAHQHGVPRDSEAYTELYRRYYDELLAHRICAYTIPYPLLDQRAERYLRDEAVNAFMVPYLEDENRMRQIWQHLCSLGVAPKAWVYPLDEPVDRQAYELLEQRAAFVHRVAPGLKVCSPFYRGPDWDAKLTPFDELVGVLDIWCANTGYCARADVYERMRQRQQAGEEAWVYVCCGPGSPFCNFFVNMTALQHRLLPWQLYRYGLTGLLYWSTTHWEPSAQGTQNPYEDIATVKGINPHIYGDGSLFYPGKQVGIDGPVSSVRLECIRDGLEDYEYLVLAARGFGAAYARELAREVTPDWTHYLTDPRKFEALRRGLGESLARAAS
jgi:hypothetical protein